MFRQQSLFAVALLFCSLPALAEVRAWKNRSGKEIQGELVSSDGKSVTLKRTDGTHVTFAVGLLSDADQQYVRAQKPLPADPFADASESKSPVAAGSAARPDLQAYVGLKLASGEVVTAEMLQQLAASDQWQLAAMSRAPESGRQGIVQTIFQRLAADRELIKKFTAEGKSLQAFEGLPLADGGKATAEMLAALPTGTQARLLSFAGAPENQRTQVLQGQMQILSALQAAAEAQVARPTAGNNSAAANSPKRPETPPAKTANTGKIGTDKKPTEDQRILQAKDDIREVIRRAKEAEAKKAAEQGKK